VSIDLNEVAEKLKKQKALGVTRDGRLVDQNPRNDGTLTDNKGGTTLEPKRFFEINFALWGGCCLCSGLPAKREELSMEKIVFSLEAVGSILVESYKRNNNSETGGILIGPKEHSNIITDVIPSTAYAERRPATYYQSDKDVEILNRALKQYQLKGYDFMGYFHKHPSGMYKLSHGDIRTSVEILQSPNYKINNYLIMCIITESSTQDFPLFSYLLSLLNNKKIVVNKATVKILPKACIHEFADCIEPLNKGVNHENINTGQGFKGTQKKPASNAIRNTRRKNTNNKLSRIEVRA